MCPVSLGAPCIFSYFSKGWARMGRQGRSNGTCHSWKLCLGTWQILHSLWGGLTQLSSVINTCESLFKHLMDRVIWNRITYLTKSKKLFCMTDIWHFRPVTLQEATEMSPTGLSMTRRQREKLNLVMPKKKPYSVWGSPLIMIEVQEILPWNFIFFNIYWVRRILFLILWSFKMSTGRVWNSHIHMKIKHWILWVSWLFYFGIVKI